MHNLQLTLPPATFKSQRNIIHESIDDNCSDTFQTPNATLQRDEFRTPLNEVPMSNLSAQANSVATHSLSPTYYSLASSSDSPSGSQQYESGTDSEGTEDSGLDENYHTPRVAKIKSMENLSLLEMEFHKASQELDRNSPRRLKRLAEEVRLPKMKSLNCLCAAQFTEEQLLQEFERLRDETSMEPQRFLFEPQKRALNATTRLFAKHKVGNAKFIGGDDTPDITTGHAKQPFSWRYSKAMPPPPIQKIRSLGTIPDLVCEERIETDPFLTPTTARRPQFPSGTQSAEKPATASYMMRMMAEDMVDGRSLQDFHTQDRMSRMLSEPPVSHMSRSPFERAYKRSALKSSTPLRQSISVMQQNHDKRQPPPPTQTLLGQVEQTSVNLLRPHSTNAAYDIMRNYSGVPRRLLDGSNRQISYIALTTTNTTSPNATTAATAISSGPTSSQTSTHSASSSSASSNSGALITFQAATLPTTNMSSFDTVDGSISVLNTPISGANSPRIGHLSSVELSSLAASPTDACSIRSNPSAVSLLSAAAVAAEHVAASGGTNTMSSCTLSPLATTQIIRRPSITMNPSSGSLVISETGSLDRIKSTADKRKKGPLDDAPRVSDRVEETRVNPNSLIDEILKDTKLDQLEESAESSGLQLYIARDGTASLGSHEVKSRINTGAFKQVVMQNPR